MRHAAHVHLEDLAEVSEQLVKVDHPVSNFLRSSSEHHSAFKVGSTACRRAHRASDPGRTGFEHTSLVFEVGTFRFTIILTHKPMHGYRHICCVGRMTRFRPRFAVSKTVPRPVLR
jgi:hypothetical protein